MKRHQLVWTPAAFVLASSVLVAATHARGQAAPPGPTSAPGIEISEATEPAWGKETTATWALALARPGDMASGEILLRLTGAPMPTDALEVAAEVPADGGPLLDGLFVTRMELDGGDVLGPWAVACAGPDATLSLREFAGCADPPVYPPPATGHGSRFAMDITLADGNRVQGRSLDALVVHFRLVTMAATPTPTQTATPAASPTVTATVVATPTATATSTGSSDGGTMPPVPVPGTPSSTPTPPAPLFPRPLAATPTATTTTPGAIPATATPLAPTATATASPDQAPTPLPPETGHGTGGPGGRAALVVTPLAIVVLVFVTALPWATRRTRGRLK